VIKLKTADSDERLQENKLGEWSYRQATKQSPAKQGLTDRRKRKHMNTHSNLSL
jgi:hypothetical protein